MGLGHAIGMTESFINKKDFAVLLPDDIILEENCLRQLISIYKKKKTNVLGVMEVEKENISKYGVIEPMSKKGREIKIKSIVEKPNIKNAPSNFGVVGRYILKNSIFDFLKKTRTGFGGEVQLTDAIAMSLSEEKNIAYQFKGFRYDCGSKLGFLEAQIASAFIDKDINKNIKNIFIKIAERHSR